MTRQWIRKIRLSVEAGGQWIDLSELRIRFRVFQGDIQRPWWLDAVITNPSPETAKRIQKEGQKIRLEAGYQERYGLIYEGDLIQKRVGRENPTDTYLALLAQVADQAYNQAIVSKTLAAGATFRDQVDVAVDAMKKYGVKPGQIDDLGKQKFPRAKTLFGMARDVLREVATATGTSWWIENGKLNMVKNDRALRGSAIVLNSRTGMIGLPQQTMDGIVVTALLNHEIVPGRIVHINQASIQEQALAPSHFYEMQRATTPSIAEDGFYRIFLVEHQGDTRGTAWYTIATGTRADGQGVQPFSIASRGINVAPNSGGGQ